jgi:RHS repeat-associated protein
MTTLDGQWTYGYDANGQLLHAVFVSTNVAVANQDLQYTYDAAGNRTSTIINGLTTTYTTNNLNQYTAIGNGSLQYDRNGNLIERKDGSATTTYTYDVRDRLTGASAPGDTWSYQYDALGHLATETHNGQTIHNLVDDAGLGDVVAQFDSTGALIAHYTYGYGLVSRVAAGGAKAYYYFDASANAVALTGATGAILNTYRYLPFGSLLTSSETIANPFNFDGEEGVRVSGPGLHFMRARFYEAAAGRFTQLDPVGITGGLNLYTYSDNDPVGESDPSGLAPTAKVAAAVAKRNTIKVAQAAVELTYQGYLNLLGKRLVDAGVKTNAIDNLPTLLRKFSKKEVLEIAKGYLTEAELKAFEGTSRTGAKVLQSSLKAAPEAAAAATEAGLLARAGGKLRRLGAAGLAALLEALAIQAAFGTGLQVGERWTWKRNFEDDFYDYLHKHRPGLGKFLEGAEDFFSINLFSSDPNDKIGPGGAGPGNFVAGDAALPYKIDFENDPTATAPAQAVTVSDILSPNFDLDSFELTGIKFGDVVLTPPPGSQYFATTVQMTQDDKTFNVNVEAGLRTATREVFATFQSIDAELQLPPEVIYGFLPPEPAHVSDPVAEAATPGRGRGQGQLTYTIKPEGGLPTGTVITNVAKIFFDENPSIATDQKNPHDASAGSDPSKQASVSIINGPPVSHVIALTSKENDSFVVKWTGDDGISGASLERFDVFASQDGGAFSAWQTGITATSALYSGALHGHTYAFYVVSTDYIGQVETKAAVAETQTTISANPWQNAEKPVDSDHDTSVTASDVILIINYINARGSGPLPLTRPADKAYVDVDGDTRVTAFDVLSVINYINAHPHLSGEAEAPSDAIATVVSESAASEPFNSLLSSDLLSLLASDLTSQPRRRRS